MVQDFSHQQYHQLVKDEEKTHHFPRFPSFVEQELYAWSGGVVAQRFRHGPRQGMIDDHETLPETNTSPQWMVGIRSFPIGAKGLFSGANLMLISEKVTILDLVWWFSKKQRVCDGVWVLNLFFFWRLHIEW